MISPMTHFLFSLFFFFFSGALKVAEWGRELLKQEKNSTYLLEEDGEST